MTQLISRSQSPLKRLFSRHRQSKSESDSSSIDTVKPKTSDHKTGLHRSSSAGNLITRAVQAPAFLRSTQPTSPRRHSMPWLELEPSGAELNAEQTYSHLRKTRVQLLYREILVEPVKEFWVLEDFLALSPRMQKFAQLRALCDTPELAENIEWDLLSASCWQEVDQNFEAIFEAQMPRGALGNYLQLIARTQELGPRSLAERSDCIKSGVLPLSFRLLDTRQLEAFDYLDREVHLAASGRETTSRRPIKDVTQAEADAFRAACVPTSGLFSRVYWQPESACANEWSQA